MRERNAVPACIPREILISVKNRVRVAAQTDRLEVDSVHTTRRLIMER